MTDNIEKLYELAKVEKVGKKLTCGLLDFGACKNINCKFCDKAKVKEYPPFTEFKQLELIKWLVDNWITFTLYKNSDSYVCACHSFLGRFCKTLEQAPAGLVCELWEDLSDEQKEEIKRILE